MTWLCPRCQQELGELNGWCEYCKHQDNIIVYNPDQYFIRDIRIRHITTEAKPTMTPQEEKFAKLFNGEKVLVKDMDNLTLAARREELADIAFTARACLTAVDDELKSRKNKKKDDGLGFTKSVNVDDQSTGVINQIKERQRR